MKNGENSLFCDHSQKEIKNPTILEEKLSAINSERIPNKPKEKIYKNEMKVKMFYVAIQSIVSLDTYS